MTNRSGPFQGSEGQPRETTPARSYLSYFRPTKITRALFSSILPFDRLSKIAPNFLHWNAHIFLFWLNHTGHSKFHNTSNTLHLLPTLVGLCVLSCTRQCLVVPPPPYSLPPFFPVPDRETSKGWLVPVPVTGMHYNILLWMCTLNTLTWPDLEQNTAHLGN